MAARNPLPALFAVALVPAVALAGVWRLADGRAPADVAGASTDAVAQWPDEAANRQAREALGVLVQGMVPDEAS